MIYCKRSTLIFCAKFGFAFLSSFFFCQSKADVKVSLCSEIFSQQNIGFKHVPWANSKIDWSESTRFENAVNSLDLLSAQTNRFFSKFSGNSQISKSLQFALKLISHVEISRSKGRLETTTKVNHQRRQYLNLRFIDNSTHTGSLSEASDPVIFEIHSPFANGYDHLDGLESALIEIHKDESVNDLRFAEVSTTTRILKRNGFEEFAIEKTVPVDTEVAATGGMLMTQRNYKTVEVILYKNKFEQIKFVKIRTKYSPSDYYLENIETYSIE